MSFGADAGKACSMLPRQDSGVAEVDNGPKVRPFVGLRYYRPPAAFGVNPNGLILDQSRSIRK